MDTGKTAESWPWLAVGSEIADVLAGVDAPSFAALAVELKDRSRRWFFAGQGRSGLIARMAAMRFMHLGYRVHCVGDATSPAIGARDALLVISGSGETPTSIAYARIARSEGARLVVITRNGGSLLAGLADTALLVPVGVSLQFGGTLFEQVSLLLLDSVVVELAGAPGAHRQMAARHANLE